MIDAESALRAVSDLESRLHRMTQRADLLKEALDLAAEWPHEHPDCLLDNDVNAGRCASCDVNRKIIAALKETP